MNHRTRNVLWIAFCLFSMILLAACTGQPDIVGKWHQLDSQPNNQVEFFRDGTLVWSFLSGKYSFPESGRIKLEMLGMAGTYKLSLSGDTLILVGETGLDSGRTYTLQRVK